MSTCYTPLRYQGCGFYLVPGRLSLAAKVVGALGRKGKRKEERRLASLLSPSRGPPRTRPHFLVFRARLLATEIQASEEETDAAWLDALGAGIVIYRSWVQSLLLVNKSPVCWDFKRIFLGLD